MALIGNETARSGGIRLVHNGSSRASEPAPSGASATDRFEELSVGLVFRSVGYRGVPLPGVPFHESWGVILNDKGRVLDPDSSRSRASTPRAGSSAGPPA